MFREKISKKYLSKIDQIKFIAEKQKNKLPFALGSFTLKILEDIKSGKISSKEADSIFEYLDELSINDNNTPEINELLFEGRILHDLGKPFGADLNLIKKLSNKLISIQYK